MTKFISQTNINTYGVEDEYMSLSRNITVIPTYSVESLTKHFCEHITMMS